MKSKILTKYRELNEKSKMSLSIQVVKYLEEPEDMDQQSQEILHLSHPGNLTYNFNNRIKDLDLQPIAIAYMNYVVNLHTLNLSHNKITDKGMIILAKLLEFAENIVEVNMRSNQIGDSGCEKLTSSLKGKLFLYKLDLNSNIINNSGVMYLNELLFTNPGILKLDVGNNRYDWDGLIAITTALTTTNSTLQVLNVDDPAYKIQDQDFFNHFGKMFLSNRGLQKISLKFHKIRFEGVLILTHHLKLNNSIRVIDFSCNQICFQGMKFITDYINDSKCLLKSIILSSNQICDEGAKIFAQGIALNKSLIHVDLTSNSINDEGLSRLAEGMAENNSVKSLKIFWDNRFNEKSIKMFNDVLKFKGEDFYPDFTIYYDDLGSIGISYLETHIPEKNDYLVL